MNKDLSGGGYTDMFNEDIVVMEDLVIIMKYSYEIIVNYIYQHRINDGQLMRFVDYY